MFIPDIDYYKKAIKYPEMLTEKQLESINDLYNKLCGYAKYEKQNNGSGYSRTFGSNSLITLRAETELKNEINAINAEHEALLQANEDIDNNKIGL